MEKEYKINIDPRILELLGPSLYTNIYYVLAELIANAYDADAKNVYIIDNNNYIRVEDDGHGMSYTKNEIANYLNVANVSRTTENESLTRSGQRRKMGRKGIGKLAALSVSENVDVLTIADGEKSGFILTRHPDKDSKLAAIPDDDIEFSHILNHGTAIVMHNPQYSLHTTLNAIKRNLLKIFPLVNSDFKIHIIKNKQTVSIEEFDKNIMSELSTIITLGDKFKHLSDLVPIQYRERQSELIKNRDEKTIKIKLKNKDEIEGEYRLKIAGWIGTYKTTRGRKSEATDFPDNFISLFANEKLGEFNILPTVGQNKLNEVYVVGQLHIDLFELTELPDMALSNRQGYKTDDPRYIVVRNYIRDSLLPEILRMREIYSDLNKSKQKEQKEEALKRDELKLKQKVDTFRRKTSEDVAETLIKLNLNLSKDIIKNAISESLNRNSPDLGLKAKIDAKKKKILISQTAKDKPLADIIYKMLTFNDIPDEDILYTNCDDEICRIPEGRDVYDYLKDFFVESYSDQKMYVIFVTSDNIKWGSIVEVGAAWITQMNHKIFNIPPFRPEHPLNDRAVWHNTFQENTERGRLLWLNQVSADNFCVKIEAICDELGYKKKSRTENRSFLETLIEIRLL